MRPLALFSLLVGVVIKGVDALAVIYPNSQTIYDQSGATINSIQWSPYPATSPAPASVYFNVMLRNGVGAMYTPNLNVSVAQNVDMTSPLTTIIFNNASSYVPGPGYQLFFTSPTDASVVYCNSDVFSIGVNTFNPSSMSYTGPIQPLSPLTIVNGGQSTAVETETVLLTTTVTVPESSSSSSSSSSLAASSSEGATATVTETSFITMTLTGTSSVATSTSSGSSLSGDQNLGGPAGQGFGVLPSSADPNTRLRRFGLISVVTILVLIL